jgi:hypothetical protein
MSLRVSDWANETHTVVEGHPPEPVRSPEVAIDTDSRSPTTSLAANDAIGRLTVQQLQQSPSSRVFNADQPGAEPHVQDSTRAIPQHHTQLQSPSAVRQQKSVDGASAQYHQASSDISPQKEALVKAALERCRQLESIVVQQRETIARHESTILTLEQDLQDFCAHAHSTIQESEEAARQAMHDSMAYREQAAAAEARERDAEAALAAALQRESANADSSSTVIPASETDIRVQELVENVQLLQKKLEEQESGHQQQLQRICENYELRINKLAEG